MPLRKRTTRLYATASPMTSGETIGGAFFSVLRSIPVIVKPAARIASTVDRLQLHPWPMTRFTRFSRSCQRASFGSSARTCSMKRQPPARLEHAAYLAERPCLVADGAEDERRDDVSNRASSNGSTSAEACSNSTGRVCSRMRLREPPRHRLLGLGHRRATRPRRRTAARFAPVPAPISSTSPDACATTASRCARSPAFSTPLQTVVHRGEDAGAKAHRAQSR